MHPQKLERLDAENEKDFSVCFQQRLIREGEQTPSVIMASTFKSSLLMSYDFSPACDLRGIPGGFQTCLAVPNTGSSQLWLCLAKSPNPPSLDNPAIHQVLRLL